MSAQLVCKVIRILETLISIILMNLQFFFSAKKREIQDLWTSGKYLGENRGELLWDSLTFGVTGVIQS